jgi:Cu+-exporting ATPase
MTQQIQLELTGLNCASCVGRAERALAAVPNVQGASVNLTSSTAQITAETDLSWQNVADALRDAGYPAPEHRVRLTVEGLSCASCVGRVERALGAVPGVLQASVNLANHSAEVTYLAQSTSAEELAQIASDSGYAAAVDSGAPEATGQSERMAQEIAELRRSVWIAALLTVPVVVLEMGAHLVPAFHHFIAGSIGTQTSWVIQALLTTAVLAGPGRRFFRIGLAALRRAAPEMNALVVLGTSAAWLYSMLALLAPSLFPGETRAVYFEAAAVICTLILIGRYLEARAKGQTGAAIENLMRLRPKTAQVLVDGTPHERALNDLKLGDLILLRPGAQVPVDGMVEQGTSYIDESMLTGEPAPQLKQTGAAVVGGTVNGQGALHIRATAIGGATVLAQIIRMVQSAQGAKLPIQTMVDKITGVFVPVVMGLAACVVAIWWIFGPDPSHSFALIAGVSVLIIACPCAMGLATPTSIMVATGRAAELGILFRRGEALQTLGDVRVMAFDKTGTLTRGAPELRTLQLAGPLTKAQVLPLLAAAEQQSEHPIARAICDAATRDGMDLPLARDFTAHVGLGVEAVVNGQILLIGSQKLMEQRRIDLGDWPAQASAIAATGASVLYAALDGTRAALIGVSDPIEEDAAEALTALHAQGMTLAMITGDSAETAQAVAARLGIDHVVSDVLPGGKADEIKRLQGELGPLCFVGDGINDAPALAQADVGIALGTGTDVAMETADLVLMSGALTGVPMALEISRATLRNIRQNLFWAFAYNAALIPVAAGILYPVAGVLLSPMLAGGAMALSSVFVVTNALRLRRAANP